jgi:hypothetical protein
MSPDAGDVVPFHPIQWPPRRAKIGAIAVTSPPGLTCHAALPCPSTRWMWRRFAAMTSPCFMRSSEVVQAASEMNPVAKMKFLQ